MSMLNIISAAEAISMNDILIYALMGQMIIFLMLALLIGIVYLMKFVFAAFNKKPAEKSVPAQSVVEPAPSESVEEVSNDDEIAAVIGAVMAVICSDAGTVSGKTAPFRVRKIYKLK